MIAVSLQKHPLPLMAPYQEGDVLTLRWRTREFKECSPVCEFLAFSVHQSIGTSREYKIWTC